MSGGVDSSVAALLLRKRGFEVAGAYLKTWLKEEDVLGHCPWQSEIEDARAVAEIIGIKFRVINFIKEYRESIVDYLVKDYRSGRTPNPDMMCNRKIKFGVLLKWASRHGFAGVATGHYCRKRVNPDGSCDILEGADPKKEQSYFLAKLTQEQVRRAHFPIGKLMKLSVREIARRNRFPNADKKDSQGICFLGKVKISEFLGQFIPECEGDIVNLSGRKLGRHQGLHRYTLGQRRGIGIPSNTDGEAYVVVAKDLERNRLTVAFDRPTTPGLHGRDFLLENLHFLNRPIEKTHKIFAKPRYRDPSTPATLEPLENGHARIVFNYPQRALAPGQVCALYDSEKLLGCGDYAMI